MRPRSLSGRLIISSAIVSVVLLAATGVLLAGLFQAALERNFDARLSRLGAHLDARTLMLLDGRQVFINGERVAAPGSAVDSLRGLADTRALAPGRRTAMLRELLFSWYVSGWLHPGQPAY